MTLRGTPHEDRPDGFYAVARSIQSASDAGNAIIVTASLSFVGLGASPPMPEWGAMIAQSRTFMLSYWWVGTFPGLAIMVTVAGCIFLGDGLRDLLDPRLRGR